MNTPRTTSAFSDELTALKAQASSLEALVGLGASKLPDDAMTHISKMQEAMYALQDAMASMEGLQNDNDMFGTLASLHGRKVRAGIELCVQWAQKKIDALLICIHETEDCNVHMGQEATRQWWQTPRTDDDRLNALIDDAERAYEQAAITVQALNAEDNARLMPAIAEMKSRLLSIAPGASSNADEKTGHALAHQNP